MVCKGKRACVLFWSEPKVGADFKLITPTKTLMNYAAC